MLGEAATAETLAQVLAHPLVKTHRMVQPAAPLAEARATWAENIGLLARAHQIPNKAADQPYDEESWERRRAELEARTNSGEAAE